MKSFGPDGAPCVRQNGNLGPGKAAIEALAIGTPKLRAGALISVKKNTIVALMHLHTHHGHFVIIIAEKIILLNF